MKPGGYDMSRGDVVKEILQITHSEDGKQHREAMAV